MIIPVKKLVERLEAELKKEVAKLSKKRKLKVVVFWSEILLNSFLSSA